MPIDGSTFVYSVLMWVVTSFIYLFISILCSTEWLSFMWCFQYHHIALFHGLLVPSFIQCLAPDYGFAMCYFDFCSLIQLFSWQREWRTTCLQSSLLFIKVSLTLYDLSCTFFLHCIIRGLSVYLGVCPLVL